MKTTNFEEISKKQEQFDLDIESYIKRSELEYDLTVSEEIGTLIFIINSITNKEMNFNILEPNERQFCNGLLNIIAKYSILGPLKTIGVLENYKLCLMDSVLYPEIEEDEEE